MIPVPVRVSVLEPLEPVAVPEPGQRPRRLKVEPEEVQDQQVVRESEFPETVAAQVAVGALQSREE